MKKSFLLILLLIPLGVEAQVTKSAAKIALETEISNLKKDPGLKHAAWSVYVQDIASSKVEAELNSQMSLIPASIQKTITTSTALALLGSSFRFETRLQLKGEKDSSGVFHGNVFITGGGDPTLGSKRFGKATDPDSLIAGFIRALKEYGIKALDGSVYTDDWIYDDLIPQSWSYEDIGNYYACPVTGFIFRENMYRLYFDAGAAIGDSAHLVRMEPELGITFINMVKTGTANSGDQVFILGSPYSNLRILDGTMPWGKKNFDVDGAMPDPALYFAELFYNRMIAAGIKSPGGGYSTLRHDRWELGKDWADTSNRVTIKTHSSPSLKDIIYQTNQWSVNLYAEAILKMLGKKTSGEGSTKAGLQAVRTYWSSKGIDLKGFDIFDGSGLSRKNRFTAVQLGKILAAFYSDKDFGIFKESLPMAGKNGMMASYLKGTVAEKNLVAKSGVLEGVRTYAGYVKNTAGKDLVFVIMVNNYTCNPWELRSKCEKLMQKIAELD